MISIMLNVPIIILNVKSYEEATGESLNRILDAMNRASSDYGVSAAVAVQPSDIYRASVVSKVPVLAQHVDPVSYGSHTGSVLAESIKFSGAKGSLVNHSEMRLGIWAIDEIIRKLKSLGLTQVVCSNNDDVSRAVAVFEPEFVAVEPPELIGGEISVSKAKPEIVSSSVEKVKQVSQKTKVLCGAGIKNSEDVSKSIELGADGVLLASGIVKAKDPYAACDEIFRGI
jgi:triosephosphate isomerase